MAKKLDDLTIRDLEEYPVWEFVPEEKSKGRDLWVQPFTTLPIDNTAGRFIGTRIVLRNGSRCWATLGNLHLTDEKRTSHFLFLSVYHNNKWFSLARYHDANYARNGPEGLAAFLGLPVHDVFPISYDVSAVAVGRLAVGKIPAEITDKLSRSELVALSLG